MATDYTTFINVLQANTGLNRDVIVQWVSLEKGVNNNILGVTSGGHLVKYPNQTLAAQATARLINTSGNYAGIRASYGKTSAQQAQAIIKSPWHSTSATGYYQRGFASITGSSGSSIPSGGTSTPITPTAASGLSILQGKLQALGINSDPNYKPTNAEWIKVANSVYGISGSIASDFANTVSGMSVADFSASKGIDTSPLANLPNLDLPGALMFVAVILVGIAFLFLGGIIVLKRPKGAPA